MTKTLIAILTCSRYLDRRNAVRDTWMAWVEKLNPDVTVKFFSGKEPCLADDSMGDIIHLYCPDTYDELPQKTLKLIEYTVANGFDRLVKTDDDTFLMPLPEYLAFLSEGDAVGNVRQHPPHNDMVDYLQGGCYSLSRRAMEAILAHGLPKTGLEDGNVGKALKSSGIAITNILRCTTDYRHGIPRMGNDIISAHTCTPQIMHEIFDANHIELLARYSAILDKQNAIDTSGVRLADTKPSGDDSVTIVVQSCGRMDLLRKTLKSLSQCVIDYPIRETIIYEDGPTKRPDWLLEYRTLGLGEIRWITGGQRVGQWMACDRLLDQVKTEYILRIEDDFAFLPDKPGFVARSIDILKRHPKIVQVSLRGSDTTAKHPVIDDPTYPEFKIQERHWRDFWGGWSGNNHVARLSDWRKIGSYGRVIGYGKQAIFGERGLSKFYLDLGYSIAVLPDGPYIQHTGERRSKAIDKLPPKPRVLIAVPACHRYAYGSHANDLHGIARQTEGRIDAVRATWWNDIKPFSDYVDAKFFYGKSSDNRTPLADEIFLNVEDDYEHLPHKMRAIYLYAVKNKYDFVYKADDDGFVWIDRLLRTDYENYDQLGFSNCTHGLGNKCNCYITGGAGYFLSKRAMLAVVNEPITSWAEDLTTGKALRKHNYRRSGHPGFVPGFEKHFVDIDNLPPNVVACHAVTPEGMHKLYGR
jgi:galactosyltransferase